MKNLKFREDGKFVIMQVSDTQDLHWVRRTMLRMLDNAYDRVKPDLVLLTGDNILGNHLRDARFGSRKVIHTKEEEYEVMKKALAHVLVPLEKRNIPFAMIYGNHDDMNEITKDEQADIYRSYSCSVGLDDPSTPECATYNIPIYTHDGSKIGYNIWMIDSAWKDKELDRCFTAVKKEAVDWYVKKSNELKAENGGKPVDSLMFQHVFIPEGEKLVVPCEPDDPEAIPFGYRKGEQAYKPDRKYVKCGVMGEYPSCCTENYGQFEAVKQQGDVRAMVFGHDHLNNFEAELDGINLVQTSCASFRCYGDRTRGVRVFVIDENDTSKYETYFLTYSDLCGNGIGAELAYLWDADDMIKQKIAFLAGLGIAAVGAAAAAAVKSLKKDK